MRKRLVVGAIGVSALMCASVAYAQGNPNQGSAKNTKSSIVFSGPSTTKGGTKAKPRQITKLRVQIINDTINGQSQPGTSARILTVLPKNWVFQTSKWPRSARCSAARANAAQSNSVCPKASVVGSGVVKVDAIAGRIKRELRLTAHVLSNGDLGSWVETPPGQAPAVKRMIPGSISKRNWDSRIPLTLQEPTPGIPTGIRLLDYKFKNSKIKVKGKTYGIARSEGCSGGKWTMKVETTYRDGKIPAGAPTDSLKCRK